jgi:hypothetical protein
MVFQEKQRLAPLRLSGAECIRIYYWLRAPSVFDSISVPGTGVNASALAAICAALPKVLINASPE